MTLALLVTGAVVSIAVFGAGSSPAEPTAAAAAPVKVTMGDDFFNPVKAKVAAGGKVSWTNGGQNPHNVTFGSGGFRSGDLGPGQGVTRKFTRAGKLSYSCTIHPGMKGTLNVVRPKKGS